MSLTRRALLAEACALAALPSGRGLARGTTDKRPDILFIMADDLGYADVSCYGRTPYKTPVIDALAAGGLRLRHGYANSAVCSATRTALVTGRYQQRFRIGLEEPVGPAKRLSLPAGTPTISSRLKSLGYRTALVGKWHVGVPPEHGPTRYGYDHFFGISTGSADYFGHGAAPADPRGGRGGLFFDETAVKREGYLTDVLADEAGRWAKEGGDAPFLLSLHFNAPHFPWEGPEDRAHSQALKILRDPDGGSLETFAKMVVAMDSAIGRVLRQLERSRRGRETIIVFTSDNGGERYSDMWPFTGMKGELLEGGIRVPLIVNWRGQVRPGVSDQVMTSMDFLPTLLAAAGGPALTPDETDGANLLPQLLGQAPARPRTLFWRFKANEQAAVRDGDWKYLRLGGKEHLFNIVADPRERAELKEVHPDHFAALKAKYAAWDGEMLPYAPDTSSEDVKEDFPDRY